METLNLGKYPKRHIDYLPDKLGLTMTPELAALQQAVIEAMATGSQHEADVLKTISASATKLLWSRNTSAEMPRG